MKLEQLSLGPDDPQPRQPLEGTGVNKIYQCNPYYSRDQLCQEFKWVTA